MTLESLLERRKDLFTLAETGVWPTDVSRQHSYCALSLSGGGIRSATFSLGVIQGIALTPRAGYAGRPTSYSESLLSSIDYLSTVSGGGYIGGFLASLYLPKRLSSANPSEATDQIAAAAEGALHVLQDEPPGRIHADSKTALEKPTEFPLAWLRDSGRYLTPTGAGDLAYDFSLALRNWVAVHYVIGTIFVLAFAFLALARGPLWMLASSIAVEPFPVPVRTDPIHFEFWWGATALLPIAALVLCVCPVGLAYWWCGRPTKLLWTSRASWGVILIVGILLELASVDAIRDRRLLCLVAAGVLVLSLGFYVAALALTFVTSADAMVAQRVKLTRWLRNGLTFAAYSAVLAVLESLGQSIYLYIVWGGTAAPLFSSIGSAGVLTLIVKQGSTLIGARGKGLTTRVPLAALAGVGGVLIILCVAIVWSFVFAWLLWGDRVPQFDPATLWTPDLIVVAAGLLGLAILTGLFPGFINLSSLQSLYSARLTRAYLGASNGARLQAPNDSRVRSTSEPVRGDDVELSDYWDSAAHAPKSLAPLHLINVTLNSTVDPAEQLVQRDRKGLPMAVSPVGYWIDGDRYDFAVGANSDIDGTPSVGKWIATSGAALSTGLGRKTSLGLALLLGAANVRLGTWWNCPNASKPSTSASLNARLWRFLFRTQSYLADEFRAKFYGLRRDWQNLSDGGHFENTGLYELLRPQRHVGFAFATDAGADPDYEFEDLGTLIRLVRIDFGIELVVDIEAPLNPDLRDVFGTPEDFRAWSILRRRGSSVNPCCGFQPPPCNKCAILLKASFPGRNPHAWIVLFKPAVTLEASEDVQQYARAQADFPQQTTADQFFDEAQWESYRKLGVGNATKVLQLMHTLQDYTGTSAL